MLPMQALRLKLGTLLAADATTLANTSANLMALIMAPFSLGETLTIADLTLATFATSTPIAGNGAAQGAGIDPASGQQIITILTPLGGWRWVVTAGTSLPQTIYGFALTDSTGATLLAAGQLPTPIALTRVGDVVDLGAVDITFVLQPMS